MDTQFARVTKKRKKKRKTILKMGQKKDWYFFLNCMSSDISRYGWYLDPDIVVAVGPGIYWQLYLENNKIVKMFYITAVRCLNCNIGWYYNIVTAIWKHEHIIFSGSVYFNLNPSKSNHYVNIYNFKNGESNIYLIVFCNDDDIMVPFISVRLLSYFISLFRNLN